MATIALVALLAAIYTAAWQMDRHNRRQDLRRRIGRAHTRHMAALLTAGQCGHIWTMHHDRQVCTVCGQVGAAQKGA